MSISKRMLLNGIKEEIRIRNANRATVYNLLTNILPIPDLAAIAIEYNFGDRVVVPEELADVLCEYNEIDIIYKKMTGLIYLNYTDGHDIPIYTLKGVVHWSRPMYWRDILKLMLTGYSHNLIIVIARGCLHALTKNEAVTVANHIMSTFYNTIYARCAAFGDS